MSYEGHYTGTPYRWEELIERRARKAHRCAGADRVHNYRVAWATGFVSAGRTRDEADDTLATQRDRHPDRELRIEEMLNGNYRADCERDIVPGTIYVENISERDWLYGSGTRWCLTCARAKWAADRDR